MPLICLLLILSPPVQKPGAGPSENLGSVPCSALLSTAENGPQSIRLWGIAAASAPGSLGHQTAFEEDDETARGLIGSGGPRGFGRHDAPVDDRLPRCSSRRDRERFHDRSTSLRC
jgi:hypothetical protein